MDRFALRRDGSLVWDVRRDTCLPHTDRIETSGLQVSVIVTYGADKGGALVLSRHVVWPMLRTIPNDTHASLQRTFGPDRVPQITLDGAPAVERLRSARLRGVVELVSDAGGGVRVHRLLFAPRIGPVALERVTVRNRGPKSVTVAWTAGSTEETDAAKGVYGRYTLESSVTPTEPVELAPGEACAFTLAIAGRKAGERPIAERSDRALRDREIYVAQLGRELILETPDPVLNRMFAFAKVRAAESVFATKGGLMHGPGGGSYYAAIWANDQAEYANPLFACLGEYNADESAVNSFRHFARFMNPEFKPIPSSIIAEGVDIWNGAGDRGDQAMIAYGAARYALTRGDREIAQELWPLIEWCLEYLRRQTGPDGVVASDSDELEGRFPHGRYNLNTSCLTYDALLSASFLARDLGSSAGEAYAARAETLKGAIERFFGAELYGFKAYRYYEGNTTLRAWIATPLCVGLDQRRDGTLDALFSPHLWTDDGIRSEMGSQTFWDRATLYAMRGALAAGAADRVLPYLSAYSRRRLLGDHVPYAIEAWPEGDQRHLSAESALYARVFTEGLFGFRPTGLRRFTVTPHLPKSWPGGRLRRLHAAGGVCDLIVTRDTVAVRGRGYRAEPIAPGVWEVTRRVG